MRLWCDVYSTANSRLGAGPVSLRSASITRVLDGVGSIRLSASGTDARARSLLVNENHVRIFFRPTDSSVTRELGRGVIRKVRAEGDVNDWSLIVEGPDDLDALTRISTKLGRKYSTQTVSDITADLVGLVIGWSASASGGNSTDARFDGASVFNALLGLAEQQGLHVRAGSSPKTVEVGAFGSAAGLRLVNPAQAHPALEDADDVALIESIRVEQDSEAVCTRLYPLGAGIGEAWLTLANSTRASPYTVQTATINGTPHHYLEDSAAVATFGVIEKVGKFSGIAPLSNSAANLENAANALYDIGSAWLNRYARRLDAYRVTARKVRKTVRPGDKVRVVYNGVITRDGQVVHFMDVDSDFWVTEVTEKVGLDGSTLDLVLASVDRHVMDSARIVIGALEELQLDGVSIKPYFNRVAWTYRREIDPLTPAVVPIRFTNATQRLNRCVVKIKTRSFVSTVAPSVVNSTHRHTWLNNASGYTGPFYYRPVSMYDSAADTTVYALLPMSIESDAFALQTGTETNEDFITVSYGLHTDTETPAGLRLYINGTDFTSALGGEWAVSGGEAEIELDITEQILASGMLQQEHEIRLECTSGQGEVEWIVEAYETIQSISLI